MLRDYKQYLQRLQNNLIQCGVQIQPTMSVPVSYKEIFEECNRLEQIFWFYSMAEISGAEYALADYPTVLSGHFKERFRARVYSQYEDVLENYKKISATAILLNNSACVPSRATDSEEVDLFDETSEDEDYWKKPDEDIAEYGVKPLNIGYEGCEGYDTEPMEDWYALGSEQTTEYEGTDWQDTEEYEDDTEESIQTTPGQEVEEYKDGTVELVQTTPEQEAEEGIEEPIQEVPSQKHTPYETKPHGVFIDLIPLSSLIVMVSHGVFIDQVPMVSKGTVPKTEPIAPVMVNQSSSHGVFIDQVPMASKSTSSATINQSSPHGVLINLEQSAVDTTPVSHGVFIDRISGNIVENTCKNSESVVYSNSSHGVYIDLVQPLKSTNSDAVDDEDWEENSESVDLYDEDEYSEVSGLDEDLWSEEGIDLDAEAEEESGLDGDSWEEEEVDLDALAEEESLEEEVDLDALAEEEGIDLDAEAEEETGLDDESWEEEVDLDAEAEEEVGLDDEAWEEESIDLDAEAEESGLDDDSWEEESESVDIEDMEEQPQPQPKPKQPVPKSKPENKDLSDYLQDGTNQVLTGIKRQVKRVTGKFK